MLGENSTLIIRVPGPARFVSGASTAELAVHGGRHARQARQPIPLARRPAYLASSRSASRFAMTCRLS